jgi:hypothetical protein
MENDLIHRHLARACARRPNHAAHTGRIAAWCGWAALLFGVLRKSAAPDTLARFDLVFPAWWIPEDVSGFVAAAALLLAGVALWAYATHCVHAENEKV